ncbi:MAG TPA: redox-regulated ATPase YchF [Candidatus Sumerlaeia bacterium]|nr:redox-regulated ATPase YchF [Candidatus Sumerlaeia bacterium]
MKIGIIGFQRSGKTAVFRALTGSKVEEGAASSHGGSRGVAHMAVVKVPDERLERLAVQTQPQKTTFAAVEYYDLAGIDRGDAEKKTGLGDEQLNALGNLDALLAVIRAFDDGSGIPPDVAGDLDAIRLELVLSDLQKVENRLPKVEKNIHKVSGKELEQSKMEFAALQKVQKILEEGAPIRSFDLSPDDEKILRGFMFLSAKPILYVINLGEDALQSGGDSLAKIDIPPLGKNEQVAAMCAAIEAEIQQLSPEEQEIFLKDYNIAEPSARRVIRICYDLLGYISFFTVGPKEVRAWTIRDGFTAMQAAGAIHSDMERGFIRAEVVRWDKLLAAGGFAQTKKTADLHIEGKEYIVKDGDVMLFLFSV